MHEYYYLSWQQLYDACVLTPSKDAYTDAMSSTGSKKLTKHMVEDIAGLISGDLLSGFPEEVLEGINAAVYVTIVDRVATTQYACGTWQLFYITLNTVVSEHRLCVM